MKKNSDTKQTNQNYQFLWKILIESNISKTTTTKIKMLKNYQKYKNLDFVLPIIKVVYILKGIKIRKEILF